MTDQQQPSFDDVMAKVIASRVSSAPNPPPRKAKEVKEPDPKSVQAFQEKLAKLAAEMAGRILWRREPVRDVAMSKRDIYHAVNGSRSKASFEQAWEAFLPALQGAAVERGHKLETKYVPKGVLGPIRGAANAVFFMDGKHDTAHPLDCVPRPEDLVPLPPLPPVPAYANGTLGEFLVGVGALKPSD